jgi:large subunit ribosomal protein L28e
MSDTLVWSIVRNNSSFLFKRNGIQLTSEPNNVTNLNTFKFSGLANSKAVGLHLQQHGVKLPEGHKDKDKEAITYSVVLTAKRTQHRNKPATSQEKSTLKRHNSTNRCKGADAVYKSTSGRFYRGDLTRFAIGRYHALAKAVKGKTTKIAKRERARAKVVKA